VNALFIVLLTSVAVTGGLTVLSREPVRQAILAGGLGLLLAAVFFAMQAPDVALSEIVVGGGGIPIMLLLAIGKIRRQSEPTDPETPEE
jgi:energy-converting hydrogenase B subunit D